MRATLARCPLRILTRGYGEVGFTPGGFGRSIILGTPLPRRPHIGEAPSLPNMSPKSSTLARHDPTQSGRYWIRRRPGVIVYPTPVKMRLSALAGVSHRPSRRRWLLKHLKSPHRERPGAPTPAARRIGREQKTYTCIYRGNRTQYPAIKVGDF